MPTVIRTDRSWWPSVVLPAALLFAGCSGGSGSSAAPDVTAPKAVILFPRTDALAANSSITVRGLATDDSGVQEVRVNGQLAATANGFLDWQVEVAPVLSTTAELVKITVETLDVLGNIDFTAAEITVEFRRHVFGDVIDVAFDPSRGALVLDALPEQLVVVDPHTGDFQPLPFFPTRIDQPAGVALHTPDQALVTSQTSGDLWAVHLPTGSKLGISPGLGLGNVLKGVAVDPAANRAFVMDDQPWTPRVLEIDLSSGLQSTFSAAWHPGPPLLGGGGLALEAGRERLLVAVTQDPALIAVSLSTGERSLFSGAGQGGGPAFVAPSAVTLDTALDRAYVTDRGARAVYVVDLASGDRTILSSPSLGDGPSLVQPVGIDLDAGGNPLVADAGLDALVTIDLATGDRAVIPDAARGAGPKLLHPTALAVRGAGLVVTDSELDAVVSIDLITGDRSVLSDASTGAGPNFVDPVRIRVDTIPPIAPERIYVADTGLRAILSVDPVSGDRAVISDDATGSGPGFTRLRGFALAYSPQQVGYVSEAFVADVPLIGPRTVVRVDLSNGDRSVLPTAPNQFAELSALAYDAYAVPARLLVVDAGVDVLYAVDPATGVATVLSDADPAGAAASFGLGPSDIVRDPFAERVIVASSGWGRVLSIDLATGARTVLTEDGSGTRWWGAPTGISHPGAVDVSILADTKRAALFFIDLRTGASTVLSK